MQQRRGDLEGNLPTVPQTSKEPHGHDGLAECAGRRRDAREEEDATEEVVAIGIDAVQNDGDMGEELGYEIEGSYGQKSVDGWTAKKGGLRTPDKTQDKLDIRIWLPRQLQADCDGGLPDQNGPDVMQHRDGGELDAVEKLEDVHADQHLSHDDEGIAHRRGPARHVWGMEVGRAGNDANEWIDCHDENQELGGAGNMVIDEAAAVGLALVGVGVPVEPWNEEAFEDIESNEEEDHEDDRDDQSGERGQRRYGLQGPVLQMVDLGHCGRGTDTGSGWSTKGIPRTEVTEGLEGKSKN